MRREARRSSIYRTLQRANPPTPRQPTPDEIADHYARFAGNLIGDHR